ncbi:hypothetical protein FHS21_005027 [Phyllobacterium trifolii]|uniref:Uncharacterized protein n=1 Tax=Phyllobacterium trifolii TaxID=300193 RepID=A0A839UJ77_9HYPH|nr:hypothetical protein [Phyllobacterium trifolii]MBB3148579.1 hypothetical protein [Phyllobacterium trifolii]
MSAKSDQGNHGLLQRHDCVREVAECQTSVPIEQRPMMSRLEDRQTVMPMGCLNLGGDGEEY